MGGRYDGSNFATEINQKNINMKMSRIIIMMATLMVTAANALAQENASGLSVSAQ